MLSKYPAITAKKVNNILSVDLPSVFVENCENPFVCKISTNELTPIINKGDKLIVDIQRTAQNGDYVFARYKNQFLIRKYYNYGTCVALSAKGGIDPYVITPYDAEHNGFAIAGVVKGVFRDAEDLGSYKRLK